MNMHQCLNENGRRRYHVHATAKLKMTNLSI